MLVKSDCRQEVCQAVLSVVLRPDLAVTVAGVCVWGDWRPAGGGGGGGGVHNTLHSHSLQCLPAQQDDEEPRTGLFSRNFYLKHAPAPLHAALLSNRNFSN